LLVSRQHILNVTNASLSLSPTNWVCSSQMPPYDHIRPITELKLAQSSITGFSLATLDQMFSYHYWWISCQRTVLKGAYGGAEGIDVPNGIATLVYFSQSFL